MKLLPGFLITSLALSVAACCGGSKEPPSRWDTPKKDDKPAATATTAKPASTPAVTATATVKPDATVKADDKKLECKKFATGSVNKAFPDDKFDGYKRTYKADKEGYAEALYEKGPTKITITITSDSDTAKMSSDYASLSDKLSGFPYKTVGKNKSNVLKGCYLVSAFGDPDEAKRKGLLGKVNFSSLP